MEYLHEGLQEIQELERDILREFIRICDKHHLRYFLIEGSLLGAVRHQGMIPWDDDIDVGMMREDYERFMQIAPAELGAQYEIKSHRFQRNYIECMTKIVRRDRFVRSFAKKEPFNTNVWIDLFVIDGMPRGKFAAKLRKLQLLAAKLMLMWSNVEHYTQNRKRPFYEHTMIAMARRLRFPRFISTPAWLVRLDRIMAHVPVEPDGDTVNFLSEYRFRTVFPFAVYGEGREILFDGIPARIPQDADAILRQIYGDYMTLPPEEDRYKHKLQLTDTQQDNQP